MNDMRAQLAEIRDRLFPRNMCAKKKRYLSRKYAARVMSQRQASESSALHVYQCPECSGWHLTKMEQPA